MRGLLRYVIRNYAFLLFLLLEVVSFVLIFNYNTYQKSKYLNSSNFIVASVYNSFNSVVNYFGLTKVNNELAEENAKLRSVMDRANSYKLPLPDSLAFIPDKEDAEYKFISAKVINNSVNKQHNYITLNKGRKDGVKPDQGIINSEGVVGVITYVSESYSLGFSVLNQRWGVSAKLKGSSTFGPLSWDGKDYNFADLMEIPFHVDIAVGDTVVTSSFSSVFPEGVMIGKVSSFNKPDGDNYYNIRVQLSTNFKALSYVEIIDNLNKTEIEALEKLIQDDTANN